MVNAISAEDLHHIFSLCPFYFLQQQTPCNSIPLNYEENKLSLLFSPQNFPAVLSDMYTFIKSANLLHKF